MVCAMTDALCKHVDAAGESCSEALSVSPGFVLAFLYVGIRCHSMSQHDTKEDKMTCIVNVLH